MLPTIPRHLSVFTGAAIICAILACAQTSCLAEKETNANPDSETKAPSSFDSKVGRMLSDHWQEDDKHYNLACDKEAVFTKAGEKVVVLESGSFLIEAESPISLKTPMSTIQLRAKSMVLVRVRPGSERTFVLLETAHVVTDKKTAPLRYGEECLVTDHAPYRGELAGESDVGLRQLRVFELENNRKMVTMEYSLIQAMEREPLLGQIVHSNHSHDKFLKSKLLKSAAVINMVTSKHGQYAGGY